MPPHLQVLTSLSPVQLESRKMVLWDCVYSFLHYCYPSQHNYQNLIHISLQQKLVTHNTNLVWIVTSGTSRGIITAECSNVFVDLSVNELECLVISRRPRSKQLMPFLSCREIRLVMGWAL
jgi:hypothetical protein